MARFVARNRSCLGFYGSWVGEVGLFRLGGGFGVVQFGAVGWRGRAGLGEAGRLRV